jgi:hypothetical protein
MNNAIMASGALNGLGHSNFSGSDNNLGGLDYGILSLGDLESTGNGGVMGQGPLFKNSLLFTLTAPEEFILDDIGSRVLFFYGTSPGESAVEGAVPEPGTFVLFGTGIGLLLVFAKRRRLFKKGQL